MLAAAHAPAVPDGGAASSSSSGVGELDGALDSVERIFRERLAVAVAKGATKQ